MDACAAHFRAATHVFRRRAGAPGTARRGTQEVGEKLHLETLPRHGTVIRLTAGALCARAHPGPADPITLLHQAQCERVAIASTFARLYTRDDRHDHP